MCVCLSLLLAVAVNGRVVSTADRKNPVNVVGATGFSRVPGALVVLQGEADSYIAQTDGEGRFHIEVVPGRYKAFAQREGFGAPRTSPSLEVKDGEPVDGLMLRLVPLGTISGMVADSDGDPLSRVRLDILGYGYTGGKRQLELRGNTRTDDRGMYRVTGLAPGRYFVRAAGAGIRSGISFLRSNQSTRAFPDTYFPSTAEPESAAPVVLAPGGEVAGINVQLRPEEAHTIRVKVTGAVSPMVVFSFSSPGGMGMMMSGWRANREFVQTNAGPGTYIVKAEDREHGLSARQVVKVTGADVEVSLALAPALRLSGAVDLKNGANVAPERMRVSLTSDQTNEVSVDSNRMFSFPSLASGVYRLGVTLPPGWYLKSVLFGNRELASPQVEVTADPAPLIVAVAGDGGVVEGTAAEGVMVAIAPEGRRGEWPELVRWTFAGDDGKFELRDVAPGDYKVFVWDDAEAGAALDPEFRRFFEKDARSLRVEPNGKYTLTLKN